MSTMKREIRGLELEGGNIVEEKVCYFVDEMPFGEILHV